MPLPDGSTAAPIVAPHCLACGAQMRIVLLDPAFPPEPEKRVYQCPVCNVFETVLAKPATVNFKTGR